MLFMDIAFHLMKGRKIQMLCPNGRVSPQVHFKHIVRVNGNNHKANPKQAMSLLGGGKKKKKKFSS